MRIDEFISFELEINLSSRAVEPKLYKHSGLTDLLRSTALGWLHGVLAWALVVLLVMYGLASIVGGALWRYA